MNEQPQRYTCPMHPEVSSPHAGLCPDCGMNLVPAHGQEESRHTGVNKHEGHTTNIFKARFWVSLILSLPIVAYAEVVQDLLRYQAPAFPGSAYMSFVLASIIFFYGGGIFLTSAYRELRAKLPGMMTLIGLAIVAAYSYSVFVTFGGAGATLYWELATLITVMLLGHWMEMRAVTGAQGALAELSALLPDEAEVIRDGKTERVPLSRLATGDVVRIRPGGRIPSDGVVTDGTSDVDESIVTGESHPVLKHEGDEVIAGTGNGDGSLTVRVSKIGEQTFLAGVMRLVAEAQASKSRLQMLSDRAAYYLTLTAVVVGGITLATWLAAANPAFAVQRMVAVLVITCPHALGLAIPLVASISTTKAAKNGFLVKQRLALESARTIDTVLFDKTGTLTKGSFSVTAIQADEGYTEGQVLRLAAAVNAYSEHPLAGAITDEAKVRNITYGPATEFRRIPGKGVSATVDGEMVMVGSQVLADEYSAGIGRALGTEAKRLEHEGATLNFVMRGSQVIGFVALADTIREESREAIRTLRAMGIETAMITGDAEDVARWVAGELGIDTYFARVLPGEKAGKVKALQADGRRVAMVGDGVNDAPALAQADVGIAIGAGTNVAIESAGIILVRNDPQDIPKIITLSRLTYRKMIQNLFWATGYNVIAIPLAAGVLAYRGILLNPAVAAFLMSVSTVIVAANALLLRRASLESSG